METRQITQVRIYKLYMKDIKTGYVEMVSISFTKESLIDWYKRQLADRPYQQEISEEIKHMKMSFGINKEQITEDGGTTIETKTYTKFFKQQTPLEWYEMPIDPLLMTVEGVGINDDWTTQENIDKFLSQPNQKVKMLDVVAIYKDNDSGLKIQK